MNAPCKDCPDRHQGCHSECKKYKEYRKKQDKLNELKLEDTLKRCSGYRGRKSKSPKEKKFW